MGLCEDFHLLLGEEETFLGAGSTQRRRKSFLPPSFWFSFPSPQIIFLHAAPGVIRCLSVLWAPKMMNELPPNKFMGSRLTASSEPD